MVSIADSLFIDQLLIDDDLVADNFLLLLLIDRLAGWPLLHVLAPILALAVPLNEFLCGHDDHDDHVDHETQSDDSDVHLAERVASDWARDVVTEEEPEVRHHEEVPLVEDLEVVLPLGVEWVVDDEPTEHQQA